MYNTLKQIDYAYDMLRNFFGGKYFGQKDFVPDSKKHPFFDNVNALSSKLLTIKKAVTDQCDSIRDFKSAQAKAQYINLIDDLIGYYDSYIMRVIKDYQYGQDHYYLKKFNSGIGKLLDVKKSIAVYTERKLIEYEQDGKDSHEIESPYLLKRTASEQLTIKEPSGEQKYGTHKVIVWPPEGDNQVYYKYFPYAPGIEFAVSSLYEQVLPNSTPETMLVKLTDGKNNAIYLASKAVTGRNFN